MGLQKERISGIEIVGAPTEFKYIWNFKHCWCGFHDWNVLSGWYVHLPPWTRLPETLSFFLPCYQLSQRTYQPLLNIGRNSLASSVTRLEVQLRCVWLPLLTQNHFLWLLKWFLSNAGLAFRRHSFCSPPKLDRIKHQRDSCPFVSTPDDNSVLVTSPENHCVLMED